MQTSQPQSDSLGEVVNVFPLTIDYDRPLSELAEQNDFAFVHFFLREALTAGVIPEDPDQKQTMGRYALVPYTNADGELNEKTFEMLQARHLEPASLRELLHFSLQYPLAQQAEDILALKTMRMRRVLSDKPGVTEWGTFPLDKTMCQWVGALSFNADGRSLIPIEIFLPDALRRTTALLVHAPQTC